jgi:uncharacterized membrane protein
VSDRRFRLAIAAVSTLGAAIATYLTVLKLTNTAPVCGTGGCAVVEHSKYAEVAGIPTAAFGMVLWVCLLASTLSSRDDVRVGAAAAAIAGVAVAAYLVYLQLAVIDAVCLWCMVNDALTLVVAAIAVARSGVVDSRTTASSGESRS